MNNDEEYVRSVWKELRILKHRNHRPYWINNGVDYLGSGPFSSTDEMWSAAAKFTRERMEKVRQVREAQNKFRFMCSALAPEEWAAMEPVDKLATAELTRLTAGMKSEAL